MHQEECSVQFTPGCALRGWLRRHGGVMRGWQRKFFVLDEGCLFCFNREDDINMANTYILDGCQLKDVPSNPDEPDKFAFEIVQDKSNGDSIMLCAASDPEKKEWMKALCYHIYAGKGGAIFGLPLEEAMKYEHRQGRSVPYIVEACISHLEKHNALRTQGIFRLAGRAGLLRELHSQFEMGQRPPLDNIDVHTVGSLLKAYMRELPQSLVPPDLYQQVMNVALRHAESSNEDSRQKEVECLSSLMNELPDINYTTLAYVCRFLHRLAANSDETKMTAHNLAMVFGPNLIRHLDSSPEMFMVTADLTQHLAFLLISHTPRVLPHRPERESVPAESSNARLRLQDRHPGLASADLLRMSCPLDLKDPSLLTPLSSAKRKDLDLKLGSQRSASEGHSPLTPPSPFEFVTDHFSADADAKKREGGRGKEVGMLESVAGKQPMAPKRNKSRRRNRWSASTPTAPVSPDSPRQLLSQDILTALASASTSQTERAALSHSSQHTTCMVSATSKSQKHTSGLAQQTSSDKLREGHGRGGGGEGQRSDRPSQPRWAPANQQSACFKSSTYHLPKAYNGKSGHADTHSPPSKTTDSSERIRPSTSILEAQVAGLKAELDNMKAKSSTLVALKSQLTDMAAKYEVRISSLQTQQQREIMDVKAKVEAERTARIEATEKARSLQAQLARYKQLYGDLPI